MVVANRNTAPQYTSYLWLSRVSLLYTKLCISIITEKIILHFYKLCYGLNVPKQGYLQIIIFYMTALHFILKGNNGDA